MQYSTDQEGRLGRLGRQSLAGLRKPICQGAEGRAATGGPLALDAAPTGGHGDRPRVPHAHACACGGVRRGEAVVDERILPCSASSSTSGSGSSGGRGGAVGGHELGPLAEVLGDRQGHGRGHGA